MKCLIAIDPGKTGAVAVQLDGQVYAEKCPDNETEMSDIIRDAVNQADSVFCIIEAVGSRPQNGVKSMFTFGRNYGAWLGILSAMKVPYLAVRPQKWQKQIDGLPREKKARKNALKAYAAARYPHISVTLANADALAMLTIIEEVK
mgnify:CR=1 FL=1